MCECHAEQFQIGDKVRVERNNPRWGDDWVGTEGIIVGINNDLADVKPTNRPHGLLGFQIDYLVKITDSTTANVGKRTNDERTHCYACGALTMPVDTGLPGSKMRICTKCKK